MEGPISHMLSRKEAGEFASGFNGFSIYLDLPDWEECGFQPLLNHWHDQCDHYGLPARQNIDLVEIPKLVPLIQIYQLVVSTDGRAEAKTVYQGARHADITQEETGSLSHTDDFIDDHIRRSYRDYLNFVLRWPHPIWAEGSLTEWRRAKFLKERYLSVPLSSDGRTIDGAITASFFYKRPRRP